MKIKLRDLTFEQYRNWEENYCNTNRIRCKECIIQKVVCSTQSEACWIKNKDKYSDWFLDQEIEVEEDPILNDKEKEYLESVLKPFKDREVIVYKENHTKGFEYIIIHVDSIHPKYKWDGFILPSFIENTMYKNMELNKQYTLKELGLFETK